MEKNNEKSQIYINSLLLGEPGAISSLERDKMDEELKATPFAFEKYVSEEDEEWQGCYIQWADYEFILGPKDGIELATEGFLQPLTQDTLVYQKPSGMIVYIPAVNPKVSLRETLIKLDNQSDILNPIESENNTNASELQNQRSRFFRDRNH